MRLMLKCLMFLLCGSTAVFSAEQKKTLEVFLVEIKQQYNLEFHQKDQWLKSELTVVSEFLSRFPESLMPVEPLVFLRGTNKHEAVYLHAVGKADGAYTSLDRLQDLLLHRLLHRYEQVHNDSKTIKWRKISGWKRSSYLPFKFQSNNKDVRFFASALGLESPKRDFITAAQQYIYPPSIPFESSLKCTSPKKIAYMRAVFPVHASPLEGLNLKCQKVDDGLLGDLAFYSVKTGAEVDMGPVNADTVEGFEILYATPGTGDASEVAGHLLLRVKLNNNTAAKVAGRENPKDLIVSFLADIDGPSRLANDAGLFIQKSCKKNWFNLLESQGDFDALQSVVQSLKGLGGQFLTVMDRQTLEQAVKNYTIEEDRNLLRYELLLTQKQKNDLIDHLFNAKKGYKTQYFFFSKNCASVLAKVIAEGIGEDEITDFSPLVSPPNTLVGLFVRKGLAKPVFPAFYSYRHQGYIAQEEVASRIDKLKLAHGGYDWPRISNLFHKNEEVRLSAFSQLVVVSERDAGFVPAVYQLASLLQKTEMVYGHKDLVCEQYTSSVTAAARKFQNQHMHNRAENRDSFLLSAKKIVNEKGRKIEVQRVKESDFHTGHNRVSLNSGRWVVDSSDGLSFLNFEAALHEQEMGEKSYIAMQRAGAVQLGRLSVMIGLGDEQNVGSHHGDILKWEFTGLSLRKFKERLYRASPIASYSHQLGLGLTVLDIKHYTSLGFARGTMLGAEVLASVYSAEQHNRHAYLFVGADIYNHWDFKINTANNFGASNTVMTIPVGIAGLYSFGGRRQFKLRHQQLYRTSTDNQLGDEYSFETTINYGPSGKFSSWDVYFQHSSHKFFSADSYGEVKSSTFELGAKYSHW